MPASNQTQSNNQTMRTDTISKSCDLNYKTTTIARGAVARRGSIRAHDDLMQYKGTLGRHNAA
jgi:hypothetical protein